MVRETPSRPGGGPGVTYLADAALPTATWSAWSCEVRVAVSDPHALRPAVAATTALMQRVDAAASRFRPDSDLSWANLNPGRPVAVSPLLVALTRSALDAAALTGGALDPTVGRDLLRLGYDRDILLVADSDHAAEARPRAAAARPTWHDVGLDEVTGLLSVPNGTRLDLGATAKAETADRAAALLHRRFGGAVLVEIGGDLAVAGERRDWQVAVGERAGGPGEQVTLGSGGLATSTTTVRAWRRGRRRMHHIVDPGTGEPAAGPWRTVSVAATTARWANVCATAAIVKGQPAASWLSEQPVAARLIDHAGRVTVLGGWPAPNVRVPVAASTAYPAPGAGDRPC